MSFKDEYEKLQRQIAPDNEFIERLSEKLRNEEQTRKKKKKIRFRAVILSASAACAAAAAALVIFFAGPRHELIRDPDILNVGADKIDRIDGLFTPSGASGGRVSPTELYEILRGENSTVYGSGKETFDLDDKLSAEQRRLLAERIKNAEETSSEPSGKTEYYMAVSESGEIVKFSVTKNILTIKDARYAI